MAFNGSICDREAARKAAGSALMGQNVYSVLAASLSSVAVAQAAVASNSLIMSICDRELVPGVQRGYTIASNLGASGCMTSSSYTTLYAGLPSSVGHQRNMFGS